MSESLIDLLFLVVGALIAWFSYQLGYAQGRLDEFNDK